jgi:hypothetical protein
MGQHGRMGGAKRRVHEAGQAAGAGEAVALDRQRGFRLFPTAVDEPPQFRHQARAQRGGVGHALRADGPQERVELGIDHGTRGLPRLPPAPEPYWRSEVWRRRPARPGQRKAAQQSGSLERPKRAEVKRQRVTTTGVPTLTRSNRSTMSRLCIRMQP